jgi:hypothetical protein
VSGAEAKQKGQDSKKGARPYSIHFPRGTHAYPACRTARILLHPDDAILLRLHYTFVNAISPFFSATFTVSPGAYLPARISFASGFSICCWIARFSGRAP